MASRFASGGNNIVRILSYVFDWIVIIIIAAIGAGFYKAPGNRRPFSVVDPTISYPYVAKEKISTGVLAVVSLIAPAIVIALIALVVAPGPTASKGTPKSLIWRRKFWEVNTGLMGLCLAIATAFFFTQGMKNLFGKPRPDLLARCMPDLTNLTATAVGGYGSAAPHWNQLVSWTVCTQKDLKVLNDGFASFPSGHSSFSFAGLTYLALYLCAKFAIHLPYLLPYSHSYQDNAMASAFSSGENSSNLHRSNKLSSSSTPSRNQAAAPPLYLLVLPMFPISLAIYISSTRFSDFMHHGFDILFGASMGILLAWASFRLYHLPIARGAGWAWGPRSPPRAFGVGVGVGGYVVGEDREGGVGNGQGDLELGKMPAGNSTRMVAPPDRSSTGGEESRLFRP